MQDLHRIGGFEFKASRATKPGRGFWALLEGLKPEKATIVAPVEQPYTYRNGVRVKILTSLGRVLLAD